MSESKIYPAIIKQQNQYLISILIQKEEGKVMKVHFTNHPLIQHKITIMRKIETSSKEFREDVYKRQLLSSAVNSMISILAVSVRNIRAKRFQITKQSM